MKKNFKLIVSILVAVFAFSIVGNTAFAAGDISFQDGTYKVDYSVVYTGEEEIPGELDLNDFFPGQASLEVKDGVQYIELTHTTPTIIKDLDVSSDVEVVNEDDSTKTVRFKADGDLSAVDMGLVMAYGSTHESKVNFDVSGVPTKEEEPEDPAGDEGNEEAVEGGNGTVENGDNDDDNGAAETDEETNPQTGDTSNIWLYAFLLVAAATPLVIKFKKRSAQ